MTEPKPRKVGRPKIGETAESVRFFLSPSAKRELEKSAANQGLSISELVRLRVFGNPDTRTESPKLGTFAPLEMPTARTQEELDRNVNIRAGEFAAWVLEYRQDFANAQKVKRKRERREPTTLAEEILHPREDG